MIRALNLAFITVTALTCLGLYRIAEEARIAQADLEATQSVIARELGTIMVLGAEWARLTQPARIQALAERHLPISPEPTFRLSSLTMLPTRDAEIAPRSVLLTAKIVIPEATSDALPMPIPNSGSGPEFTLASHSGT